MISNPYDPFRGPWSDWRRPARDVDMRVSDAERRAVADELSAHFADGRLDQTELNERLGVAMSAKTRGDLAHLLDDLPHLGPPPSPTRPHRLAAFVFVVFALLIATSILGTVIHPHIGFLLLAALAFLFFRRSHWNHHHHHDFPHPHDHPGVA